MSVCEGYSLEELPNLQNGFRPGITAGEMYIKSNAAYASAEKKGDEDLSK